MVKIPPFSIISIGYFAPAPENPGEPVGVTAFISEPFIILLRIIQYQSIYFIYPTKLMAALKEVYYESK